MKKERILITITFILLGISGITIGLSVASFCVAINKSEPILHIISYFTLLLFVLELIVLIFIYFRNIETFKGISRKKGENNENE